MRTFPVLIALAAVGLASGLGCNRQQAPALPQAGSVAVIDLDAIAHRIGSDKQIVDSITQRQSSLSQQLRDLAKSYNEQIAEQKKTLVEAPPEQSEVQLASWQQQASANLSKVKQQAELDLQRHRTELVKQFREQIKPVARRVAASRGLSVIVTKNDSVLYDFEASADITEAVVTELLATRTAPAPASPVK